MAGNGPPPKPAAKRRRVGPSATRLEHQKRVVPVLPGGAGMDRRTREWWQAIWTSPMASQYVDVDRFALERLAGLVDSVHRGAATMAMLGEIRLLEDRFGLSPVARL